MTAPRLSYGAIIERLTAQRPGATSVTIKLSAQHVVMPEVTVAAGVTDEELDTAVEQAIRAFTACAAAALPEQEEAKKK